MMQVDRMNTVNPARYSRQCAILNKYAWIEYMLPLAARLYAIIISIFSSSFI